MPKYYRFLINGYCLYFTARCTLEAFHVHASDKHLEECGSAKFFVREDGTVRIMNKGTLSSRDLKAIIAFIGINYKEMYAFWVVNGGKPEYYRN